MLSSEELSTTANFLLDCAKLLFGSLVASVFVPGVTGKIPFFTFIEGLGVSFIFLICAAKLNKAAKSKTAE